MAVDDDFRTFGFESRQKYPWNDIVLFESWSGDMAEMDSRGKTIERRDGHGGVGGEGGPGRAGTAWVAHTATSESRDTKVTRGTATPCLLLV